MCIDEKPLKEIKILAKLIPKRLDRFSNYL